MYYFISSTNIFISHSHTTHHTPSDKNSILSPIPYIFLNICCHPCFTILLSDPEKETGYRRANTKWCRVYLSLFFATSLISTFSSSFSPFLSPVNSTVRTSSSSTALTVSSYHFHCRGNRYKLCDALPSESELFLCSFFSLLSLPCLFRFFFGLSAQFEFSWCCVTVNYEMEICTVSKVTKMFRVPNPIFIHRPLMLYILLEKSVSRQSYLLLFLGLGTVHKTIYTTIRILI